MGIRRRAGYRRRDGGLSIKNGIIDSLVGLDIRIEQTGPAADHGLTRSGNIPRKPKTRLEEQIVVVVRGLHAALERQVGIENAQVVIVPKPEIQRKPWTYLPIVLEPRADGIGGDAVDVIAEPLSEAGGIGGQGSEVPGRGIVPRRKYGSKV